MVLEKININSNDWEEEYESFEEHIEYLSDLLGTCIVTGNIKRWDGVFPVLPKAITLKDLIDNLKDVESIEVKYDKEDNCITVLNHHHDGTDRYCLWTFDLVNAELLVALSKDINNALERIGENTINIGKANKKQLWDFVVENLEEVYR
jgi:hypothetical protein